VCIYCWHFFQPLTISVKIFWLDDDVVGYWRTTTAAHAAELDALKPSTAVIWPFSWFWNSSDEVISWILFDEMFNETKISLIKPYKQTTHLEYYPKFPKTGTETCHFIFILHVLRKLNFVRTITQILVYNSLYSCVWNFYSKRVSHSWARWSLLDCILLQANVHYQHILKFRRHEHEDHSSSLKQYATLEFLHTLAHQILA
jgi:hypothetical protein